MKTPKIDTSGQDMANKAIADAQIASNNLRKNFQADISTENIATVVAGGSANGYTGGAVNVKKKQASGSGLASTLGIQV